MSIESRLVCTFEIDGLKFGIFTDSVQEVLRPPPISPVPWSKECVAGLMNLRGQLVTVLDLRKRLNAGSREKNTSIDGMNIILRGIDESVSLIVDRVGDVFEVDFSKMELPLEKMNSVPKEILEGIYKLEEGLLLILNVEQIFTMEF